MISTKKFAAATVAAAILAGVSVTALADTTAPATTTSGSTTTTTQTGTTSTGTTATGTSTTGTTATSSTSSTAGVLPGSPLYFLDRLFESIQLFFTSDPQAKVNLYVSFADERLSELKLVTSQTGNTPAQQAAAQQLVTDVVKNLSSADSNLETAKLNNVTVSPTATQQVQQAATQTQVVVHQTNELPATLIPQILQTLNQIAQDAGALSQVKVEAVMQAKAAGVQPGRLALTVKMAQNAGKPVTTVAPMLNTQTPTQVAQQLGLDPNTFTKLEIKVSNGDVKVEAVTTGTGTSTTPTAAAADWNNQIALPGGVTKVLDYKYEAEGSDVEYQVTYIDGSGQLVNYKYESKDGKVEAKLTIAGQKPGNGNAFVLGNGNGKGHAYGKAKKGEGNQISITISSGKGDENEKDREHEDDEHDD